MLSVMHGGNYSLYSDVIYLFGKLGNLKKITGAVTSFLWKFSKHEMQYAEAGIAEVVRFTTFLNTVELFGPNCMVLPCR